MKELATETNRTGYSGKELLLGRRRRELGPLGVKAERPEVEPGHSRRNNRVDHGKADC